LTASQRFFNRFNDQILGILHFSKKVVYTFSALKQKKFSHITLYASFFDLKYIFSKQPDEQKSVNRKMKDAIFSLISSLRVRS